jgi:hypothetical protein
VISAMRRLAGLQSAAETETAFGGRSRVWSEVATLWVDLQLSPPRDRFHCGYGCATTNDPEREGGSAR